MTHTIEYYSTFYEAWKPFDNDECKHTYEDLGEALKALYICSRAHPSYVLTLRRDDIKGHIYVWENEQMIPAEEALYIIELLLAGERIKAIEALKGVFLDVEIGRYSFIENLLKDGNYDVEPAKKPVVVLTGAPDEFNDKANDRLAKIKMFGVTDAECDELVVMAWGKAIRSTMRNTDYMLKAFDHIIEALAVGDDYDQVLKDFEHGYN